MENIQSESDLMSLISQMYGAKKYEVEAQGRKADTGKIFKFVTEYALNTHGGKFGFNKISEIKKQFSEWRKMKKETLKASHT